MPRPYQLNADHPVLDFVNTLDNRFIATGPLELLSTYADLLDFMLQSKLIDSRTHRMLATLQKTGAAERTLRSARQLRESLAAALYGALGFGRRPSATDLATVQRHAAAAAAHREMVWQRSPAEARNPPAAAATQAVWTWGRFKACAELPLWILALSAAALLTSGGMSDIRMCRCDTCRWLFLDVSKNHSRRWCDMKICGNRMKARRFLARRRISARRRAQGS